MRPDDSLFWFVCGALFGVAGLGLVWMLVAWS